MNADPTVVSIKGRIQVFGARLEHAPHLQYIGRACTMGGWRLARSIWANPFSVRETGSAEAAVDAYKAWMLEPERAWLRDRIGVFRTLSPACWCRDGQPCHGRPLLRWATYGFGAAELHDLGARYDFGDRPDASDCREAAMPVRAFVESVEPVGDWVGAL